MLFLGIPALLLVGVSALAGLYAGFVVALTVFAIFVLVDLT